MEAKQNSLVKFMQQQDAQFIIPVYQRNYDWRIEHCKQLLDDVRKVGRNNNVHSHFIGSIVYIQLNHIASSPELTIIDGQQRLTTLTLLVSALAKKAKLNGNEKLSDELTRRFLINEFMNEDEKLKLKPIKKDNEALKFVLNLSNNEINEYSRITENFNYFIENINPDEIEVIKSGINKLICIEIALDIEKDDPQKIFQSLNSTGLDLSQADLIRNYILMGLPYKEQTRIYENHWVIIEKNTTENDTKNYRMSDFIRDFLTFKYNSIPNKDKVFEVFKERCIFKNNNELTAILEELTRYSKYYYQFINPDVIEDKELKNNVKLIKKLQINVSYPFLLQVFNTFNDGKITLFTLCEVLEIIQSFVWRRFVCGVATNALNKIFMDFYKDIDESDFIGSMYKSLIRKKGSQRFPNNDEIIKELEFKDMYYINPKNRSYFLERLENYGYSIQTNIDDNPDVSIEHIFPQNPNKDWKLEMGDEINEMKKYLNTASNLTLSAFNRELSNSSFNFKRDLPEKGFKASTLRMDKMLIEFEYWNLESLNIRFKWIIKRFIEIWKYPENMISDQQLDEFNIFDIDPMTIQGTTPLYCIFFETKNYLNSWRALYLFVSEKMINNEPHMFFDTDLKDRLKLTNHPETLRDGLKISSSYFIEGNLSAPSIVRNIIAILDKCETDDELIIKLK